MRRIALVADLDRDRDAFRACMERRGDHLVPV